MSSTDTDIHSLNLYQKLAAITGEVGAIKKGGRNQEQKFDFIEYAAVAGELRGLFAKYNVLIVPYMQRSTKHTRTPITSSYGKQGEHVLVDFTFVVYNADDPKEKFSVTWTGEATDFGDKATNKAATSALKYYLMRQFNISEKGEDPDAESPQVKAPDMQSKSSQPHMATKEQIGQMLAATRELTGLVEKQAIIEAFKALFKCEPTKVPAAKVDSIMKRIEEAKAKKANADMEAEARTAQESAITADLNPPIAQAEPHGDYINSAQIAGLVAVAKGITGLVEKAEIVDFIESVTEKPIGKVTKDEVEELKMRLKHRHMVNGTDNNKDESN